MATLPVSPPSRSLLKAALIGCTCLVLMLGVAFGLLLTQMSSIAAHAAARVLPPLSRELGYEIRTGQVKGGVLPLPYVQISDVTVSGQAGEPPLLVAKLARANVALWPLLRSFGREVEISSVTLQGVTLSIVTRRDGSSNLGKLVGYWAARARTNPSYRLDLVTIRSAEVAFFDLGQSPKPRVQVAAFEADCRPSGAKAALDLRGRLGAEHSNFAAGLKLEGNALRGSFTLSEVDVTKVKTALPEHAAGLLSGGRLSLQGQVATDQRGAWVITARGAGNGLRLGNGVIQSTFDLRTTAELGPSAPAPIELTSLGADRFGVGLVETKDLTARATLDRHGIRVAGLAGKLPGGSLNLAEARLDLRTKNLPWTLRGTTHQVDMTEFGRSLGLKLPLSGKCSASFDVAGAGLEWTTIRPSLKGTGRFNIEKAVVGGQVTATLTRSVRNALDRFGMGGLFPELGALSLGPFGGPWRVEQSVVRLEEPITLAAQVGGATLGGTIGLDQKLSLSGNATLSKNPILGTKTHGSTLPIAIRGTLSNPVVEVSATPDQLVRAIAGAVPTLSDIQGEAKRQLKTWLDGLQVKRP
jgi:hypothetical protein